MVVAAVVAWARREACYQGLEEPCWIACRKVLHAARCPRFQSRMLSSFVVAQRVPAHHAAQALEVDRL